MQIQSIANKIYWYELTIDGVSNVSVFEQFTIVTSIVDNFWFAELDQRLVGVLEEAALMKRNFDNSKKGKFI
jgi:hypothetical protein